MCGSPYVCGAGGECCKHTMHRRFVHHAQAAPCPTLQRLEFSGGARNYAELAEGTGSRPFRITVATPKPPAQRPDCRKIIKPCGKLRRVPDPAITSHPNWAASKTGALLRVQYRESSRARAAVLPAVSRVRPATPGYPLPQPAFGASRRPAHIRCN